MTLLDHSRDLRDTSLLLLFAETLTLAARLAITTLQNKLVAIMTEIYIDSMEKGIVYPADDQLLQVFEHLYKYTSSGSHAKSFLICFVGSSTTPTTQLERQLRDKKFNQNVCKSILAEEKSFDRDPLKYTTCRFRVNVHTHHHTRHSKCTMPRCQMIPFEPSPLSITILVSGQSFFPNSATTLCISQPQNSQLLSRI